MHRTWTAEQEKIITTSDLRDEDLVAIVNHNVASIREKRSRMNPKIRRMSETNGNLKRDFFDHWSRESAYIAGFTCADGYFDAKCNMMGWGIHPEDAYILEAFKSILGSGLPVRHYDGKGVRGPRAILEIRAKEYIAALQKVGIKTKEKTYRLVWPKISRKYIPDFVRGYFDGDGCVRFSKKKNGTADLHVVFTGCCKAFLESLRKVLQRELCAFIPPIIKKADTNAYRLRFSGWKAVRFGEWVYTPCDLFLRRKKAIWDKSRTRSFGSHNVIKTNYFEFIPNDIRRWRPAPKSHRKPYVNTNETYMIVQHS